jgi:diguanylate cyclase (GGDEF)-like protein
MLSLNLSNAYFFSALVELTLGVGMLAQWRSGKRRYLLLWSYGFLASAAGHLLVTRRDILPDLFSILGGNFGITLSSVLFYLGTCAFLRRRKSKLPWLLLGLEIVLLIGFTYIRYDTDARVYVYTACQASITLVNVAVLFAAGRERKRDRYIDACAATLFFTAVMLVRMVGTWFFPAPQNFMASGNFQILFSFCLVLAHIGYALAFGNMHASALNARLNERAMELENANRQLESLSVTDPLTGLYNRRHFDDVLERTFNRTKESEGDTLAFSIFDIDHFKRYNDRYGHPQGDVVLQRIAEMLRQSMRRASDFVFRLGGEEFCVIFSVHDTDTALRTVENLRRKIEGLAIPHLGNPGNVVTASFGLTCVRVDSKVDQHAVYVSADNALYEAKSTGRNRVVRSAVAA